MPEPLLTAVNCPFNLLRSFKDDVHLKHKLTFETCAYLAYTEGATDCGVPFEFLPVLRLLLPFAGHSHYSGIYSSHFLRPLLFIGFSGTKCCLFLCLRRWSQLEHDYTVQCTAAINNNWITMSVYCTADVEPRPVIRPGQQPPGTRQQPPQLHYPRPLPLRGVQ